MPLSSRSSGSPEKKNTGLALLLAALAMLGPFSVDAYLPAFPAIQVSLHVSAIEVQQTLTAYMASFAIMMLWHGAISDAYGRRNIILVSLSVFLMASLGCALSHTIHYLWLFRVVQGISAGAGIVVGRAIIRDLYVGAAATRVLSLVTMIFSVAPAIGPIVGGWIVTLVGWRAVFLALCAYTVAVLWLCFRFLPESLPKKMRQALSVTSLIHSYKAVFSSTQFHCLSGVMAFNFAGMFLYIAAAPVFLTRHLGLSPHEFAWQFVPMVGGIFLGALGANRLAGRLPVARQVQLGFFLLFFATAGNVIYHSIFPPALPWSMVPLFFYAFGMSLNAPVVTLMILDLFPATRGIVASCQAFSTMILSSVVAGVIAPVLDRSAVCLSYGQLCFSCIGLVCWILARRNQKKIAY